MPRLIRTRITLGAGALALLAGGLIVTSGPAGASGEAHATNQQELHDDFLDPNVDTIRIDFNGTLDNCGLEPLTRSSNNSITVTAGMASTITQTCTTDVFSDTGTGEVTISGLTVVGSSNHNIVDAAGNVTVLNSTFSGVNGGDGVNNSGTTTTLTNSQINDVGAGNGVNGTVAVMTNSSINGVTGDGNGLDVTNATMTDSSITSTQDDGCNGVNSATATLTRSTIIGCTIGINTGTASLTNSTVTGASSNGIDAGSVTLVFSDVVGNDLNINTGTITSTGSVVAKPGQGGNCNNRTTTSHGFNFDDDGSCKFDQSTDQSDAGDPGLGAIADNGGSTKTLLPQAGSKLLNKVPPASCSVATDQRGITRPQDTGCEVGSVEIAVETPATPATPAAPVEVQPSLTG